MRSTTAETVHAYYDRFNAGDWEGMLSLLSDDVAHDLNQGGREVGKPAFRAFLQRMARSYKERLEDIVILGDDARIAAEYLVIGTYVRTDEGLPPATGQTYRLPGGAFFDLAGGRITRVTNHYNLEQWLRLIGSGSSG
ncbi:MAG: isopropylmalate/homocitrate/citramalate synthase [Alphaproteobacteria bacterium]|nr:isopropylmalate/homocitrate/citramalate synthase [Alphaproteobacteria bacterium]